MKQTDYQHHYFSHELAKTHGVEAAIVLRFLTDEARRQQRDYGDHFHCLLTTSEIRKTLPYVSRAAIERLFADLSAKGAIKIKAVNTSSRPAPSTYQIAFNVAQAAGKNSIRLDVGVAIKMGIPCAIVIEELRYRFTLEMQTRTEPFVGGGFKWLSSLLPYSPQTLTAALKSLEAARMILPDPRRPNRFRLPATDPAVAMFHRSRSNLAVSRRS